MQHLFDTNRISKNQLEEIIKNKLSSKFWCVEYLKFFEKNDMLIHVNVNNFNFRSSSDIEMKIHKVWFERADLKNRIEYICNSINKSAFDDIFESEFVDDIIIINKIDKKLDNLDAIFINDAIHIHTRRFANIDNDSINYLNFLKSDGYSFEIEKWTDNCDAAIKKLKNSSDIHEIKKIMNDYKYVVKFCSFQRELESDNL